MDRDSAVSQRLTTMNHAGMSHGSMSHADMDMGDDHCSMNMLFTWKYKNVCVIFSWWHIKKFSHLLFSFLAIVLLTYGYEYLKYYIYKSQINRGVTAPSSDASVSSNVGRRNRLSQSCWYGLQVGYSFMLMLIFMTYNGWLMLAVVIGAVWGHYSWSPRIRSIALEEASLSCH